jgi:hypothetical protein
MATAAPAILGFAAGIAGTVSAFAAKYAFDFRLGNGGSNSTNELVLPPRWVAVQGN